MVTRTHTSGLGCLMLDILFFWFVGKYTAFSSLMRFKGAHVFELRYIRTSCLRGLVLNRKFNLQLKGFRCDCCRRKVQDFSLKCISMLLTLGVGIGVYSSVILCEDNLKQQCKVYLVLKRFDHKEAVTKCIIRYTGAS